MPTACCPECGTDLSPAATASGFCADCGKPLPAILPKSPPELPASARHRASRSALMAWGTVRAGLGLTFYGILLFCLCVLLLGVVGVTAEGQQSTSALAVVAVFLSTLGLFAAVALALAGGCMSCAAPGKSGAKGWAWGVCAFLVASLVLGTVILVTRADSLRLDQENTGRIFRGESTLSSVWGAGETQALRHAFYASMALCNICYLLFLRRVAHSFRRRALALGIVGFLGLLVLFVASLVVLTHEEIPLPVTLPATLPSGEQLLKMILAGVAILGACYVVLIGRARRAVTRGILKS
ncbi:MAG: hypothetical protein HYS12_10920 [Planctomycetes bacterium]|nr:hypothetical protein [Planctomycetota bacterium]